MPVGKNRYNGLSITVLLDRGAILALFCYRIVHYLHATFDSKDDGRPFLIRNYRAPSTEISPVFRVPRTEEIRDLEFFPWHSIWVHNW